MSIKYFKIPADKLSEYDKSVNEYEAIKPIKTLYDFYVIPCDVIDAFKLTGILAEILTKLDIVSLNQEDFPDEDKLNRLEEPKKEGGASTEPKAVNGIVPKKI